MNVLPAIDEVLTYTGVEPPVLYSIGNSVVCSECRFSLYISGDDVRAGFVTHGGYDGLQCSGLGKRFKFIPCAEMMVADDLSVKLRRWNWLPWFKKSVKMTRRSAGLGEES